MVGERNKISVFIHIFFFKIAIEYTRKEYMHRLHFSIQIHFLSKIAIEYTLRLKEYSIANVKNHISFIIRHR